MSLCVSLDPDGNVTLVAALGASDGAPGAASAPGLGENYLPSNAVALQRRCPPTPLPSNAAALQRSALQVPTFIPPSDLLPRHVARSY